MPAESKFMRGQLLENIETLKTIRRRYCTTHMIADHVRL